MAELYSILPRVQKQYDDWYNSRPPVIQEMIKKYPINKLYRLKSTGQRVTIYSYSENGTVKVNITGQFNFVTFSRRVFGIPTIDLEECDLPKSDEVLGDLSQILGIEA